MVEVYALPSTSRIFVQYDASCPLRDVGRDVQPLLQGLVPHPPIVDECPTVPLDLSCKGSSSMTASAEDEPFPIFRANSCSSNGSGGGGGGGSCSSSGGGNEEDRRLKRKEQNKAAAQNYRQRKKSFSGLIESEHDLLAKRNLQLMAQKQKLEDQILRMRGLLNEVIEESKKGAEEDSGPKCSSPSLSVDGLMEPDSSRAFGRERKNTWPMALTGKDRKKEQNKLASWRFRQRRRQELTNSEREAQQLESNNRRLEERCDEMESKIKLLKDLMNRTNATQELSLKCQQPVVK